MIAATSIHIEFEKAIKISVRGINRQVVLFVTVDPERDTLEKLGSYMGAFNPDFLGLSGTADEIATVTQEFKVIYQKTEGSMPDTYSVDHSAGTYVFDRDGRVRLFVSYGANPDELTGDILQLIKEPL